MTDRPIIFSGAMVRALLDGNKTQTRRLATSPLSRVKIGDRLYVREAWSHSGDGVFEISQARILGRGGVIYQIDENPKYPHAKYWPSIHMPREFSRLTLTVVNVRTERLQCIGEDDARAEGSARLAHDGEGNFFEHSRGTYRCGYASLWDHLHGAGSWDTNPEVVALTFVVVAKNIDRLQP